MKQYYFLSGIARSGSTLLGSILNQNPEFYVSPTSPLLDLYCLTEESIHKLTSQYTFDLNTVSQNIHKSLHHSFYYNIDKPYIFDKHRGWPRNINTVKNIITQDPKVICTYRPIAENIVSFLKLANKDPNNFIDKSLRQYGREINLKNRAMCTWEHFSADPFYSMADGLKNNRKYILVINYHDLVVQPEVELNRIYDFLELPRFDHIYNNIENTCTEDDMNWGMKNLHNIRPNLEKTSDDPLEVLGEKLFEYFDNIDKQLRNYI